jgi:hypothetical protein
LPFEKFDRSRLKLEPLGNRKHLTALEDVLALDSPVPSFDHPAVPEVARRISLARAHGGQVVLIMGAHVIKLGLSRYIIDLMQRGALTHVALNGAGLIHDYELALVGGTAESVPDYIRTGQFGMWIETSGINEIASEAASDGIGLGEAAGRVISGFPHDDVSILAAGHRLGIPVTVHVAIGQDIVHQHPNCDGAAVGAATYTDFLVFTNSISKLEGGVLLNIGTAVAGPEIYLKALSMARNVACQEGREVAHFTTAVFDLASLPDDLSHEAPKTEHSYYYRPWKTILLRTVADGGESFYIRGHHRETVPNLWRAVFGMQDTRDE